MRVFLAGATGVLGLRIVPLLVESGHVVAGLTRSPEKASLLTARGAVAVIGDVFDREAISQAVADFRPDLVMSQLTDLPDEVDRIGDFRDANIRIRREGVANLLGASGGAGVEQVLVQSVAWELPGEAGRAVEDMERAVLEAGGTVLRYGQFYGPGTYHPESPPEHPRIHLDDAARRTVEVLEFGPGIVELVEDPG
ncbi:MAG TPA: NAD(P)H-binding protein [Acidimicrobiia bacterium]|nr:NAD(P)H-binding protein [Acidimicrobiia bacterium]